jgi:hypothetical protein
MGKTFSGLRGVGIGNSGSAPAANDAQLRPLKTTPPAAADARKDRRDRLRSRCHWLSGQQ